MFIIDKFLLTNQVLNERYLLIQRIYNYFMIDDLFFKNLIIKTKGVLIKILK